MKLSLTSKPTNVDMEGGLTDSSGLMVLFLLLPVVMQKIAPLLMLIGYGLVSVVRIVFGGQKVVTAARGGAGILMESQSNRS